MVIVGSVILPHGALIFDGDPNSDSEASRHRYKALPSNLATKFSELYDGCMKAGEAVGAAKPDLVVLHTPHGISLSQSFGIYTNPMAGGTAEWNECWQEKKVELPMDRELSLQLLAKMQAEGIAAEGINAFGNSKAPLCWGEVIPAWFINRFLGQSDVKYVIMCQSSQLRNTEMESERLRIGRFLYEFLNALQKRVVIAISGDLSHMHQHECDIPIYQAAGWSPLSTMKSLGGEAKEMDRALEGWSRAICELSLVQAPTIPLPTDREPGYWKANIALPWLRRATELQPRTYSCGFVGFWILHGILEMLEGKGIPVQSNVLVNHAPTYYGMMAVVFSWDTPN